MAHLDNVEPNVEALLVSLSLRLSCVFLMGGETREVKPDAVWLRAGNVSVMAGRSRMAYRGIPSVLGESWKLQTLDGRGLDADVRVLSQKVP